MVGTRHPSRENEGSSNAPGYTALKMTLQAGSVLGPYEIGDLLGAGGMGEVYRATDTRLGRDVAIKVLPDSVAGDAESRLRFEREARGLSQLEHPNVCRLYDIGKEGDTDFLVMELLEGETLRARLDRSRLSEAEATRIAIELADGLEAAHRKGLVHRDLKPGNVMLTSQGAKILDFGLARPFAFGEQQETLIAGRDSGGESLTAEGTITGTLQYMAPEQAEAKAADQRSDIFSLGAIFYEMLTGDRAFAGDSPASVIASIMSTPPAGLADGDADLPAASRGVLGHCLARDPDERWQSARDLAIVLREDWAGNPAEPETSSGKPWWIAAGIAGALVAGWLGARLVGSSGIAPGGESRTIRVRQQTRLDWDEFAPKISPDGQFFLFTADPDDTGPEQTDIYLQRIDGDRPIRLTEHPGLDWSPAFSPDQESIAFCSTRGTTTGGSSLYVMGSTGESIRKLADEGCWPSWSPDGLRIAYTTGDFTNPQSLFGSGEIHIVELATETTIPLVTDMDYAMQPSWSPDGRLIAFWGLQGGNRDLYLIDLASRETARITTAPSLEWGPTWGRLDGRLYYSSDQAGLLSLWQLDPLVGDQSARPVPLPVGDVWFPSFSRTGDRLLFARRRTRASLLQRDIDRAGSPGAARTLLGGSNTVSNPLLSPSGRLLAFHDESSQGLFVLDLENSSVRRLVQGGDSANRHAKWSAGGWIVFSSDRGGSYDIWAVRPDGSGMTPLTNTPDQALLLPLWASSAGVAWGSDGGRSHTLMRIESEGGTEPPRVGPQTPAPTCEGSDFYPYALSPDGNRIVGFSPCGTAEYSFWILDLTTDAFEELYPFMEYAHPCWLDNERLVLPGRDLVIVDLDGEVLYNEPISPRDPEIPVRCSVTPDGKSLIMNSYSVDSDVWLAEFGEAN